MAGEIVGLNLATKTDLRSYRARSSLSSEVEKVVRDGLTKGGSDPGSMASRLPRTALLKKAFASCRSPKMARLLCSCISIYDLREKLEGV